MRLLSGGAIRGVRKSKVLPRLLKVREDVNNEGGSMDGDYLRYEGD